jgi:hypothetical protein
VHDAQRDASGPTTKATRYVDIGMVSAKRMRTRPSSRAERSSSGPLDTASRSSATSSVTPKTALKAGSSQQGKARRASVASNWVTAMRRVAPSSAVYDDR